MALNLPFLVIFLPKAVAQNVVFVTEEKSPIAPRSYNKVIDAYEDIYFYSSGPEAGAQALEKSLWEILVGNQPLSSRESWIKDYLTLLKAPDYDLARLAPSIGTVLFSLYPDLDYFQARAEIVERLKKFHLDEVAVSIDQSYGVDRPESCPSITLLNSESAKHSLRITNQAGDTCYAHATVRAADYWNYSTGNSKEISSILSAAFGFNSDRPSDRIDVDYGYPHILARFLSENGGCKSTDWDALAPDEVKVKYIQIQHIRESLKAAGKLLSQIDLIPTNASTDQIKAALLKTVEQFGVLANATSNLTKEELAIFNKAVVDFSVIVKAADVNLPLQQRTSALNQFIEALNGVQADATSRMPTGFADKLFRKAFCRTETLSYRPFQVTNLFYSPRRDMQYTQLIQKLTEHFKSKSPQPLIMSICTEVFNSPHLERDKICDSLHAVLITGQKYDHKIKQCTYQILNSWGGYSASYSAYEKEEALGTVWLPREQLTKAATRLEYLSPK